MERIASPIQNQKRRRSITYDKEETDDGKNERLRKLQKTTTGKVSCQFLIFDKFRVFSLRLIDS